MKKVLILTASTGDGHNKAAEALADAFAANNFDVVKYDFLKHSSHLLNTFVVDGYKLLAFKFPKLYGNLYRFSNFKSFNRNIPGILINNVEESILDEINRHQPDIIIGTHAFSVSVISKLKRKGIINLPFISIVTDFKAHGSYFNDAVDAYITGSRYTRLNMIRRKVPREKIFAFGIPLRKDFLSDRKSIDKDSEEYFNVLLMGGGMGLKFIGPVFKKLLENKHKLNIVAVCGNNKPLKEALENDYEIHSDTKNVRILGFTTCIPELMDEADIIITKPGGLTVSEAIAKRLPMLLPYAIPGQEKENMAFLFRTGAALDVRKLDNFNEELNNLIDKPDILIEMRKKLDRIFRDYSIEGIIELSNALITKYSSSQYLKERTMKAAK